MGYQDDLKQAQIDLAALILKAEEAQALVAKQKRKVTALAELCNQSEFETPTVEIELGGITEAVVAAMRSSRKEWMNVGEIKSQLEELGFPVKGYKAPIATISSILKRLIESEEVVMEKHGKDYAEYKWVGPKRQIDAILSGIGEELTSGEEQQLERILLKVLFQTTMPLSVDDLHKSCINNDYHDRSPRKTRAFMEALLKRHERSLKRGKTLKGENGFIGKKGSTW